MVLRSAWERIQASLSDWAGWVASVSCEQVGSVIEVDAVGLGEDGDQSVVGFDTAGFDEFESGLGPAQRLCDLLAAEVGLAAEGLEGLAQLAAGGAADRGEGDPEGAAGVGGVAVAAGRVGKDGGVGTGIGGVSGAEADGGPGREAEDAFAGSGFGGLA